MTISPRRLAAAVAVSGLAVASMTGCGLIEGTAVDCALVIDTMTATVNDLTADEATFATTVAELRADAAEISDAELKEAVETFADTAEQINAVHNDPELVVTEEPADIADLMAQQETFTEKCSTL